MNTIENQTFDEERALYNLKVTNVIGCRFEGAADGESVLKEASSIVVDKCSFSLRYPMWHNRALVLRDSHLCEPSRAPLWYCGGGIIERTRIESVKALRECSGFTLTDCTINSPEFGWKCSGICLSGGSLVSEYAFFDSKGVSISGLDFSGKYSFQYMDNLTITDSNLDTKDAFWHSKNVTVKNSTVKGEYLAWFSDGLTLEHCRIIGTQPFCYCKNLRLIDCEMIDTDLAFEYSEVEADIRGGIDSVVNPLSGRIVCDSLGELVSQPAVMECHGEVVIRNNG